jgi:hypothetical protein
MKARFNLQLTRTGELSGEQAAFLVSLKVYLQELSPLQDDAIAVLEPLIQSHASDKPDIWKERSIALSEKDEAQPIVIGIWDTGVDASVFPKRMFHQSPRKGRWAGQ